MKMTTMFKKIDWKFNVPTRVTLAFDEPKISDNKNFPDKKNIWYGIKTDISGNGPNGFNATPNLKMMIDLVGAKAGDEIVIEKRQGDKFAYFSVNGKTLQDLQGESVNVNVDTTIATPAPAKVEYQATEEMSDKQKLDILWKKHEEDDIPF